MGKQVRFNEVVVVHQQVLGTFFLAKKTALASEEDIAKEIPPFDKKEHS